jgi:hypothetical protein
MKIGPGDLLIFNLLLQAFDGTASYFFLSLGAEEANPLVESAIESWGLGLGLLFWKLFACILLFVLFSIRVYREALTIGALGLTAAVYSYVPFVVAWLWISLYLGVER